MSLEIKQINDSQNDNEIELSKGNSEEHSENSENKSDINIVSENKSESFSLENESEKESENDEKESDNSEKESDNSEKESDNSEKESDNDEKGTDTESDTGKKFIYLLYDNNNVETFSESYSKINEHLEKMIKNTTTKFINLGNIYVNPEIKDDGKYYNITFIQKNTFWNTERILKTYVIKKVYGL